MEFEEWFARCSFMKDREEGEFDGEDIYCFNDLSQDDKNLYLYEAKFYLLQDMTTGPGWPTHILERLRLW